MTEEPTSTSLVPGAVVPGEHRLVVVPLVAGPVRPLATGASGPRDDLDVLVDEVFGPSTDETPGAFDLALLAGGAVVLAWALLTGAATWLIVLAAVAMVLGAALPARSLVRRFRGAATSRAMRQAERRGYLLDVSSPSTRGLLRAHDALVEAAAAPGSVYSKRAIDAAHLALVEVATLLRGRLPDGSAQEAYVGKRTRAIEQLTGRLEDADRRRRLARLAGEAAEAERERRRVAAVTMARDELQAEDRFGSLAQLDRLTTRLDREVVDGDR